MRPLPLLLCLPLACLCLPGRAEEVKSGPLAADKNLPGSFHPFNVTQRKLSADEQEERLRMKMEAQKDKPKPKKEAPPEKEYTSVGKFHCLVSEYDLDPVVMLFARGLTDSEGFRELLVKLNGACDKYRVRRLRAFVVFLDDGLRTFHIKSEKQKIIEKKDEGKTVSDRLFAVVEGVAKLSDSFQPKGLDDVPLTVGALDELKKYELGPQALTAVLYRGLRIRATHAFAAADLADKDAPAVGALMKEVEKHLVVR